MIPEIGHFSLILALFVALALGTLGVIGGQQGRADWMALARPGAQALWALADAGSFHEKAGVAS
jgi:cytochrome c-type biogenesis protein CcmF